MKPFLKYFIGAVGTTILGQPSTSTAVESSTTSTHNDSFLTKLGQPSPRSAVRSGQSEVRFVQSDFVVDEGAGVAKITVERSCGERELPVAFVSYESHETNYSGSAAKSIDYHHVSGTLRWEVFECGPKTFSIPIIEDSESEFTEALGLTLSNAQATTIASGGDYGSLSILDNDVNLQETSLSFSSENYAVTEGPTAAILIKREGCAPHSPAISAELTVTPISADKTDFDENFYYYYESNPYTLKLDWNEVRQLSDCYGRYFYLRLIDDAQIENTESIAITLSNPSESAVIEQGNAVLNIIDNDGSTIGFSQNHYLIDSDTQTATITVVRKNCVEGYIPETALEGIPELSTYYTTIPNKLVWQENECGAKDIQVNISDLETIYKERFFYISQYYQYDPYYRSNNVTVTADDLHLLVSNRDGNGSTTAPSNQTEVDLYFTKPVYNFIESGGIATIDVKRDGCSNSVNMPSIQVFCYTYSNTYSGTPSINCIDTSNVITWQENECGTKSFTVSILDDSIPESSEIVDIRLNYGDSAVLFIVDDDVPTENALVHHDVFKEFLYQNDDYTLYPMELKAPLTSISSDPNIVTIDDIVTARAVNVGQATVTTTDVMGNSIKRIITVVPEDFAILTFNSTDKVKVGDALEVKVTANYKNPDPEQLLDLWVFIESPNLDRRLYITSSDYLSSLFSYDPQPIRINLEKMDNTYPVFRFGVTPAMAGKYTLYAVLAKRGENPLVNTQAQMSNLARATVNLLK